MSETVKARWYADGSDDVYPMYIELENDTYHFISVSIPFQEYDGIVQTLRYVPEAENAKLRELIIDLWHLMDGGGLTTGAWGPCKEFLDRMHELGIEARCEYE